MGLNVAIYFSDFFSDSFSERCYKQKWTVCQRGVLKYFLVFEN